MRSFPTAYALTAVLLFVACSQPNAIPKGKLAEPVPADVKGWRSIITIEEAEKKYLISDPRLGKQPVVFGFRHDAWMNFKAQIRPDDQLVEFYTPPPDPSFVHGFGGFEIVRNGKVVDSMIDIM